MYVAENLLLDNCNRENQVAGADVVDDIEALDDLAEAGVYAVEVLGVLAIVADEELRAAGVLTSVSHRHNAAIVVLAWGRGLALDTPARAAGAVTQRAAALNNKVGDNAVESQTVVETALGQLDKIFNSDRSLFLVEFGLHIALFGRDDCVFHNGKFWFSKMLWKSLQDTKNMRISQYLKNKCKKKFTM